jgi:hypothetical protein
MAVAHGANHDGTQSFKRNALKEGNFLMLGNQNGKVGWILLWAIGVPVPLLFLLFLMRGCT